MALPHVRDVPGVAWSIGSYSLGFERSTVMIGGKPYLGRWILYVLNRTIRLHKFYRGDDERAFHDHPWPFWTFPLCSGYWEKIPLPGCWKHVVRWVPGWRVSYRPSSYQHIVLDPDKPFYTIVVTGQKDRSWGFWPSPRKFVPWREWK